MKTVFENNYLRIQFDKEEKLLISASSQLTAKINNEEIRKIIEIICHQMLQLKPENLILNGKDRGFIINIEIQEWVSETLLKTCIEIGLKKLAIIKPEEPISSLATEQTLDEVGFAPFEISVFESLEKAEKWIKS